MTEFRAGFLWGSATAAHQVEGGNHNNDWWEWEHRGDSPCQESSGDGIDHWNRYREDFALLASLGQNAHRFSLEWSRIEPAENEFSHAALDHYARVLDSLHDQGLTAFVTLYHFTLPRWFAQRGGWMADDAVQLFGRYVERVADRLGDLMPYVGTVNEPSVLVANAYLTGAFAPGEKDIEKCRQVNRTLAVAHRVAVAALRSGRGRPAVGTCLQISPVDPLRPGDPDDLATVRKIQDFFADPNLDDLAAADDPGDFVGLQYYSRGLADATAPSLSCPPPEGAETTQMGWEVYPAGFGRVLRELATLGLPIIVTENGIATTDDEQRRRFLTSHLTELKKAIDDGVDVRGYFHWSAFDNFEWGTYTPRFGRIGIDRDNDLRRIVRPSAVLYGEVARANSLAPVLDVEYGDVALDALSAGAV